MKGLKKGIFTFLGADQTKKGEKFRSCIFTYFGYFPCHSLQNDLEMTLKNGGLLEILIIKKINPLVEKLVHESLLL